MNKVAVVDYGLGNLRSVAHGLEHCGGEVSLVSEAAAIRDAHRLVLPGVGAFENGMAGLRERGLVEALLDVAASGRPVMGICLGMQMLLDRSHEFGLFEGLGLIPGEVVPVPPVDAQGRPHRIPIIGWYELSPPDGGPAFAADGILAGCRPGRSCYFVHSFMARTNDPADVAAVIDYNGVAVPAAVQRGKVIGCQFHPEKSGPVGLDILRRFLAMEA